MDHHDTNIKSILIEHLKMYPLMQLQDVIKLFYQHEFGAEHFIDDEDAAFKHIREEFTLQEHSSKQLFEKLSDHHYRLYLDHPSIKQYHLKTITKAFVKSSKYITGNKESFKAKLDVLKELPKSMKLPFSYVEIEDFLNTYEKAGYPAISHSDVYKENYHPHYRLVNKDFKDFFEVFSAIDALMQGKKNIHVAIDGMCGSGKSYLASLLSEYYDCNVIRMDDFFLQKHQRTPKRYSEAGGNIDYVRFNEEVVKGLLLDEIFNYQTFDCQKMQLDRIITIHPKKLTIIEGSYSMHPLFLDFYDLKVFLKIDPKLQLERIAKRSPTMIQHFIDEWIPMEQTYHQAFDLESKSDILIEDIA